MIFLDSFINWLKSFFKKNKDDDDDNYPMWLIKSLKSK